MTPLSASSLWLGLAVWVLASASDYAFTLACARMYQSGVREVLVFEGSYELTPYFQRDIDALRRVSPRFIFSLLWSATAISIVWLLSRQVWPEAYAFLLGAMLLIQLAVHVRHVRNFVLFRTILAGRGVRGRLEYSRHLSLRLSALDLTSFAIVFFVGFLATQSTFLLGGAAGCLPLALKHLKMSRKYAAEGPSQAS